MGINPFDNKKESVSYELQNAISNRMYILNTAVDVGSSNLELTYDLPDSQVIDNTPNKYQSKSTVEGRVTLSSKKPDTRRVTSGVITAAASSEKDHARYIAELDAK